MAAIHCFGVGLVGSYVARKLAESGFSVHAYDPQPHRVMGIPGIEIHHLEPDEDPIDLMLDLVSARDGIAFEPDNEIVVNMIPGDILISCML